MEEVVALHYHVVEFKERKTFFHALLVALGAEHVVDREACAHVAQKLYIIELEQPVLVVDEHGLALAEVDEAAHLLFEAFHIVIYSFGGHHLSEVGSSGRVAYHCGSSAHKGYRLVACHLESLHQAKSHEVSHMERIRRRVESDIKRRLAVVNKLSDFFLVCHLSDKTSGDKFLINLHLSFSPFELM